MSQLDLFGLGAEHARLEPELSAAFSRVLASGTFILGAEVEAFEHEVAAFLGVQHAVAVSSGSDALVCALTALGCGPGHEVVLPAFSFFATPEAICRVGAKPRFVDVELDGFGMDLGALEASLGASTRAILPVHLYGCPARLDELERIAARAELPIVEDAAQAFGSSFAGRAAGAWGRLGCFSFFPTKPLGGFGDGGMVVTSDAGLAARCKSLRAHGAAGKHQHAEIGGNYRLDALQAALLRVKLPLVERRRAARAAHAAAYVEGLRDVAELVTPRVPSGSVSAHALFTVRVLDGQRDGLARALLARGIQTAVYYPRPLPAQPALASYGYRAGQFPQAELACQQVLSLPLFAGMSESDRLRVVEAIHEYFR